MRPPLNAGENVRRVAVAHDAALRFNEAPAKRGGKLPRSSIALPSRAASMRPPLNAGENDDDSDDTEVRALLQ